MKKKIFLRGLLGFPLGMALGDIITIFGSMLWAKGGVYAPCVPALVEAMGGEVYAVALQTFLCGFMGAAFAMSSVIWEIDRWSIAKQTGIYFLITALVMMPIAYITNWMEHSLIGFLSYFGIFVAIFIIVWTSQYFAMKKRIEAISRRVKENNGEN